MEINIGDKIINKEKGTCHFVESIDLVDGNFYYFTEDSKCFPSNIVELYPKSLIGYFFSRILKGETLTEDDYEELELKMSQMNIVRIDKENK